MNKTAKAQALADEALEIQQNTMRPGHPDLVQTYELHHEINTTLGNHEDAAWFQVKTDALRANLAKEGKAGADR